MKALERLLWWVSMVLERSESIQRPESDEMAKSNNRLDRYRKSNYEAIFADKRANIVFKITSYSAALPSNHKSHLILILSQSIFFVKSNFQCTVKIKNGAEHAKYVFWCFLKIEFSFLSSFACRSTDDRKLHVFTSTPFFRRKSKGRKIFYFANNMVIECDLNQLQTRVTKTDWRLCPVIFRQQIFMTQKC